MPGSAVRAVLGSLGGRDRPSGTGGGTKASRDSGRVVRGGMAKRAVQADPFGKTFQLLPGVFVPGEGWHSDVGSKEGGRLLL